MPKKVKCPICDGSKKQTITITTGIGNPKTEIVNCVTCNGTGEVDDEYADEIERMIVLDDDSEQYR
jgi:hypothetical protein